MAGVLGVPECSLAVIICSNRTKVCNAFFTAAVVAATAILKSHKSMQRFFVHIPRMPAQKEEGAKQQGEVAA